MVCGVHFLGENLKTQALKAFKLCLGTSQAQGQASNGMTCPSISPIHFSTFALKI